MSSSKWQGIGRLEKYKLRFEDAIGYSIYKTLPVGVDLLDDIKNRTPSADLDVIFDVGANIGQTALPISRRLPKAKIFCFEPNSVTYEKLSFRTETIDGITCFNLAMSHSCGQRHLVGRNLTSRLVESASMGEPTETVSVTTVDAFSAQNGIAKIDLLKIDTEGHDLDVLKGAELMLRDKKITFILAEVGMNPDNKVHVPLKEVQAWLEARDYYIYGLYEQTPEFDERVHLRRCNAAFVASGLRA